MKVIKKFIPDFDSVFIKTYDGDISRKWHLEYYDDRGKRHRPSGQANRNKDPQQRLRILEELKARICNVSGVQSINKGLIDHLYEWLEYKRGTFDVGEKRETSYLHYRSKIRSFAKWYQEGEIDVPEAEAYLLWLKTDQGLENTSRNDYRVMMKQAWNWLVRQGYCQENPFANIPRIKHEKTPFLYFQPSQVKRLQRFVEKTDPQLWLYCKFIYYCFARTSEIRLMKVGDIFFEEKKLLFRKTISKNRKRQFVRIPDAFISDLAWIMEYPGAYYIFSHGGEPGPRPLSYNTMRLRFGKYRKELNIPEGCKLYSFKHTGVKDAVQAGCNLKHLQLQLRHHSLDQLDQYLRRMGLADMGDLAERFPKLG